MPVTRSCQLCNKSFQADYNRQFYCSISCRFWSKIEMGSVYECWEWQHSKTSGYGYFSKINGKRIRAHRMAWELVYGEIPKRILVLHKCDNRCCCNPLHLFLGSHADNTQDMIKKNYGGCFPKGIRHPNTRLTEVDVKLIRLKLKLGHSQTRTAKEHDITQSAVSHVFRRTTWKHIS